MLKILRQVIRLLLLADAYLCRRSGRLSLPEVMAARSSLKPGDRDVVPCYWRNIPGGHVSRRESHDE